MYTRDIIVSLRRGLLDDSYRRSIHVPFLASLLGSPDDTSAAAAAFWNARLGLPDFSARPFSTLSL